MIFSYFQFRWPDINVFLLFFADVSTGVMAWLIYGGEMPLIKAMKCRQRRLLPIKIVLFGFVLIGVTLTFLPRITDTLYEFGFFHPDPIVCNQCFVYHPRYTVRNEAFCGVNESTFLLILVASRPDNITHRYAIRETWGGYTHVRGERVRLAFLIGLTNDSNVQQQLISEVARHHDIVQGEFIDSYRNLTYKSIMGLQWASTSCYNARFILKTDDDTFVNIDRIVGYLETLDPQEEFVAGNCFTTRPIRDQKSKWYIREDEYGASHYPMYCNGFSYIMSMPTVRHLLRVQANVPYIYIEDVYITGMCRNALNIPYRHLPSFVPESVHLKVCDFVYYVSTAHYVNDSMFYVIHSLLSDEVLVRNCINQRRLQLSPAITGVLLFGMILISFCVYISRRRNGRKCIDLHD